ncbi:MAG TPA: carbohydrate-binding family 9-like protein, partial [Armatimonadota bacterium]|nr:carbohydrate-binding family 9-like protein [Armatimonadota bacterium]
DQTGLLNSAGAAPLRIGHDSGAQTLNGALSGVRIHSDTLDAATIAQEYQASAADYIPRSPFPNSPIIFLTFDEGEGDVAADSSVSRNDARMHGGWEPGKFGSAMRPGPVGGASASASDSFNFQEKVTVEAWVRQDQATKAMQRIAFRSSAYGLYTTGEASTATWYVMAGGEWSSVRAPLPQGQWTRVTGTYDGANLRLYFDGEEAASAPKIGLLDPNRSPLIIGHGGAPADTPFQGLIDDVYVIGEAVTEFPERRSAEVANPDSAPFEVVPYVADELGGVPAIQVGKMPAPTLDATVDRDEWSAAARVELRDAASGQAPTDPTTVRVGYDNAALHIAYICAESDVEGLQFVSETTERDGPVWKDDCAEILIQPDAPDGEYFHFVVNPGGAIYDAKGNDADYNSAAAAAASIDEQADEWTLEMSIPWADLGADGPPTDARWAINFCREQYPQKSLYAWSPTRSFHQTDRFGRVAWADVSRSAQAGKVTVYGRVMRDEGERVAASVTVRIGDRIGMTRGDGVFKIAGVPEGDVEVRVEPSPIHHPVALNLVATAPQTILIPPPLEKVDLQAHKLYVPTGPALRVLPVPIFEEPTTRGVLLDQNGELALSLTATRGEYEPVTLAVYAAADVADLSASVSDLKSGDATIAADAIDLRRAARTVQRKWYTSPINDSVVRTRYLFPDEPDDIAAGQFRQYWLTLHVPGDAAAGDYAGTVTVAGGGESIDVPLSAHIIGATLR